jgi:curved DNA-binding protein
MARDYYEVLGVARDASQQDIQRAYRKLARKHHPDVNKAPGAEDRFKEINEAYRVLSDPEERQRYDNPRPGPEFRGTEFTGTGQEGFDFEDLFSSMFGSRAGGGTIRGADQEAELQLTVEEAYRGGTRKLTLTGPGGPRTYEVNIPAGVVDGQRIRLAGQGGRSRGNAPAGDLYLVARIAPDSRYRLKGKDIYVDLPVTPWEAALGASLPVPTPGGQATVKLPPGSSSGRRLRLRGQGMPARGAPGDLYAEVKIMVPAKLTPRERELFEDLAKVSDFDPRKR